MNDKSDSVYYLFESGTKVDMTEIEGKVDKELEGDSKAKKIGKAVLK